MVAIVDFVVDNEVYSAAIEAVGQRNLVVLVAIRTCHRGALNLVSAPSSEEFGISDITPSIDIDTGRPVGIQADEEFSLVASHRRCHRQDKRHCDDVRLDLTAVRIRVMGHQLEVDAGVLLLVGLAHHAEVADHDLCNRLVVECHVIGRDDGTEVDSLAHVASCLHTHQVVIDTVLLIAHERDLSLHVTIQIEAGVGPGEGVFGVIAVDGTGIEGECTTLHTAQFGRVVVCAGCQTKDDHQSHQVMIYLFHMNSIFE